MSSEMEYVALSLDVVCFAIIDDELSVLLLQRAYDPFASLWALPGGVAHKDERLPDAARRLLAERRTPGLAR